MSRMINDIPSSELSHNSRVFKLHIKMKNYQVRFAETIKGLEKTHSQPLTRPERIETADKVIAQKYDDYMETLRKKEVPKEVKRIMSRRRVNGSYSFEELQRSLAMYY
jgi:hypothetical protein